MSLIFNIIFISILNIFMNLIYFNHIKFIIDDYQNSNLKEIRQIDDSMNYVKQKQIIIEKSNKDFENSIKSLEKNKINTEEIYKKNSEFEEKIKNFEIHNDELNKKNIHIEQELKNFEINNDIINKKNLDLENNFNNIKEENNKIISNVYEQIKNKKSGGNINEVRFLSKIKNTSLIDIENDIININKIDTDICVIKVELKKNVKLNIKKEIKYKFNKLLTISSNIYNKNNNNILHVINPINIKIIDNFCIIRDDNIITNDDQILCIYLHLICDKYSFS